MVGALSRPPLLIFADDWGRHPSGCQHLVRCLLDRYQVWWVNTIGTRRPRLDRATFNRGLEKLGQWLGLSAPPAPLPSNLRVLNPIMWPWYTSRFDRRVNRDLLLRQLTRVVKNVPEGPPIAISKVPIVADLMDRLPVQRWVYNCVDDISQWPGLDREGMQALEERAIQRCDILLTTSEVLQDKLARLGRQAHLLTHGVDHSLWRNGADPSVIPGLEGLQRPLVVFWGVLDRRMDVPLVRRLAGDLDRGTLVFVGPQEDPDPELFRLGRIACLAPLQHHLLPHLAREASVLVMPYADLAVTRACQPLKLMEYLATNKPAVARDLPATRSWGDCLDLADSPVSFSQTVRLRLQTGLPEEQRRARTRLDTESWAEKARQFEQIALRIRS